MGRRGAGRRLRADQPAARAVADRAGRAVAVPAGDPAVRQPALHPGRAGAGVRLPDRRGAGRDRAHGAAAARHERVAGTDRPGRGVGGEAVGADAGAHGAAQPRRGRPTTRRSSRARATGLVDFATWCALAEVHGDDVDRLAASRCRTRGRRRSPRPGRSSPTGSTSSAGCSGSLDEQLDAAQRRATASGMALGIVHDLAVGVHPDGADTWALQDVMARGVSVGAPPDAFNQVGPGLVAAAVAAGPAGRGRLRAVPRHAPHRAAARRRGAGRPRHRAVPALVGAGGPAGRRGHLRPLRPRGARRHPGAGGAGGRAPWSSARTSARSSRGCATTSPRAACSGRRSCGSSATDAGRRRAAARAVAASCASRRSRPTTCRRRPATWPASTSGSGTTSGC